MIGKRHMEHGKSCLVELSFTQTAELNYIVSTGSS